MADTAPPAVVDVLADVLKPEDEERRAIKAQKRAMQLRSEALHLALEMHRVSRDNAVSKAPITAEQLIDDADAFVRYVQAGARS